jgi:hypothetical protein
MKILLLSLFTLPLLAADKLPSGPGLAAKYPGDAGIEGDPRVVQVEKFEQPDVATLATQWESVSNKGDMTFTADVPPGSAGRQSLLMDRRTGSGGSLYRRLKNAAGGFGHDRIFARYYLKFAEDSAELHHFGTCLGGTFPAVPWPSVKAGIRNDGAKSFWSGIEPFGKSWNWEFYTYWCEMRGSPPRGQTWGNSFIHDRKLPVEKGRWICVEQMIKMNDVGDTNGEQALWLDGKLVAHLGKGFPKGRWTFDKFEAGKGGETVRWNDAKGDREHIKIPDGGVPFEGYRWRTAAGLNVNYVWLYAYSTKEGRVRVSFDDVVVATDYIGPMAPKK